MSEKETKEIVDPKQKELTPIAMKLNEHIVEMSYLICGEEDLSEMESYTVMAGVYSRLLQKVTDLAKNLSDKQNIKVPTKKIILR